MVMHRAAQNLLRFLCPGLLFFFVCAHSKPLAIGADMWTSSRARHGGGEGWKVFAENALRKKPYDFTTTLRGLLPDSPMRMQVSQLSFLCFNINADADLGQV